MRTWGSELTFSRSRPPPLVTSSLGGNSSGRPRDGPRFADRNEVARHPTAQSSLQPIGGRAQADLPTFHRRRLDQSASRPRPLQGPRGYATLKREGSLLDELQPAGQRRLPHAKIGDPAVTRSGQPWRSKWQTLSATSQHVNRPEERIRSLPKSPSGEQLWGFPNLPNTLPGPSTNTPGARPDHWRQRRRAYPINSEK